MKHFQNKSTVPENNQFSEAEFEGDRDIDHVAQILSPDIARLLMAYYSGVELKIPKTMHRQHHIALHIGFENACALSEYSNGAELCVPKRSPVSNAARGAQIVEMVGNGVCRREIALELGICMRQLRRITQKLGLSGKSLAKRSSGVRLKVIKSAVNAPLTALTTSFDRRSTHSDHSNASVPVGAVCGKYGYFLPQTKQVNL